MKNISDLQVWGYFWALSKQCSTGSLNWSMVGRRLALRHKAHPLECSSLQDIPGGSVWCCCCLWSWVSAQQTPLSSVLWSFCRSRFLASIPISHCVHFLISLGKRHLDTLVLDSYKRSLVVKKVQQCLVREDPGRHFPWCPDPLMCLWQSQGAVEGTQWHLEPAVMARSLTCESQSRP